MKTLSDKVWKFWEGPADNRHLHWIPAEDVKQFIKDLKEDILKDNMKDCHGTRISNYQIEIFHIIDKLAGDKLI